MAAPVTLLDAQPSPVLRPQTLPAPEARPRGTLTEAVLARLAVAPGDRILELGCGSGATLFAVAQRAPRVRVVGVDSAEALVRRARMRDPELVESGRVRLRVGSAADLSGFVPGSFDRIYATHEVYFWADPRAQLQEIRRVLRPGGQLLLGFRPAHHEFRESRDLARYPARRIEWLLRDKGFGAIRSERRGAGAAALVWIAAWR